MLAFVGATIAGLVAPSGCVFGPNSDFLLAHDPCCPCSYCEASCGMPTASGEAPTVNESADQCAAECGPPWHHRLRFWHHLPHPKLYEPEAGIFNFCVPPQCLNPPPPLPPGRFFPVPVQPAFAQRGDYGYGLLNGYTNTYRDRTPTPGAPCP